MRRLKVWAGAGLFAAMLGALCMCAPAWADGGSTATIHGKVVDAGTGFALAGVLVQTEGPTIETTKTDQSGHFELSGLIPGVYSLLTRLDGYVTTESEPFRVAASGAQTLTLSIQRGSGVSASNRVLGVTTVRGTATLQKAAVIYKSVSAESLQQLGYYRVADYINQLPGMIGGRTAQPGDDVSLSIRGIGSLETLALIDGHPIGPRGNYNYELSPVFGLSSVDVIYGSGSDLYGVNAIGGVVNMQTLEPTANRVIDFSQSYGTWDKLASSLQMTGTEPGGKIGYAFAFGSQGLDGPVHHDSMYQASAAYDQYATDPAVRALGTYVDDTSFINRSVLAKLRYNFSTNAHFTTTMLGSAEWDDKTGNGDNDYVPLAYDLAIGQQALAAAIASGTDACNIANPAQFTVGGTNSGTPVGTGPNGQPDGGNPCQTPQSFAAANFGYQGAGPAWQAYHSVDYHAKYDNTIGNNAFVIDSFSNVYHHTYDRTFSLPCQYLSAAQPCVANPFWYNNNDTSTGLQVSDNISGRNNEVGGGFYYQNTASLYVNDTPAQTPAQTVTSPITHDTAFFIRDAYRPQSSDLTTYLNAWFKHSTITNTSLVDPRLAFVYNGQDNVYRVAVGRTSSQPTPDMLSQPFSPASVGAFSGGGVTCSGGFNSIGNIPSSDLQPERASDEELSWGHRFFGDSTAQLTLYNTNIFEQLYSVTAPLSSVSLPGFDPTPYVNVVLTQCPGLTGAQALALLGVSGTANIGHTIARGLELSGRERWTPHFYTDYTYDTQSAALETNDPSLINPAYGGSLFFIPGAQLPGVPLHKYSFSFDYTFGNHLEARLDNYHLSSNNSNNLPAYGYSDFDLTQPIGESAVTVSVSNVFNSHADYRNTVGFGEPLALNQFAQPSDYQPLFGAGATERFNLPYRTIELHYSTKIGNL